MEDKREKLIHLHHCRGAGWKTIQRIMALDSTLTELYSYSVSYLREQFSIRKDTAEVLHHDLHTINIKSILGKYRKENIIPVTIYDEHYPTLLSEIFDPPWVFYCKGAQSLLQYKNTIAVVGTRDPSAVGIQSTYKLVRPLTKNNWVIVSGLAKGIDTIAHTISLTEKGKTIAVLGSGFNHIYPKQNEKLAQRIATTSLLLSEYPPHVRPQKWQFPERNRIVSGLSRGTIIIEAKEKSGALITADQALEQGRDVFAVPGTIVEERAVGPNRLIQQGAKLVLDINDILEEWNDDNMDRIDSIS
ncbi:DNA-processing protein DprA [Bacillus alkalicellulosilyticus]|uniref:DNA-processing protein DprA n=1 Tax=Alkalihalobacterium alkalicellulosilyticum TaxID=1912214 RepID=UPI001FE5169C|nr:DNA-processing protein DprA [Bacillus alkalicellulosilyticus]